VLQKTSKANFWDVENLETALVMKEICRVLAGHMVKQLQSIERMHSSSQYYYYYYFDHEAWDLLRPLTQMVLSWNWFRKVGRDQDHYPPCWLLKRVNKLKDHFGFLHQVRLNICRFLELKYLLTQKKTQLLLLAYMKPGPYF
jgi:hypothetical protein